MKPTDRDEAFMAMGMLTAALLPIVELCNDDPPSVGEYANFWKSFISCGKEIERVIEKHRKKMEKSLGIE